MKNCFLLIVLLSITTGLIAQDDNQPEKFPYVYATYSGIIPGGDFAERFGPGSDIGAGIGYKTASNWMFSAEATFLFTNNLNEDPLDSISGENGQIINMYGDYSQVYLSQRGLYIRATAGKIIPVFNVNKNSGLFLKGSVGILQHRIFIDNKGNNTPQILGEYAKGYDRMCYGLAISEFIGWQNFSSKNGIHFFAGFEFTQGFTENRRSWDFATNQKLEGQRLDLLYSIKIGWYIPFMRRQATGYYYY